MTSLEAWGEAREAVIQHPKKSAENFIHIKCLIAIWLKFHRNFSCSYNPEVSTKKAELEFMVNFQYS